MRFLQSIFVALLLLAPATAAAEDDPFLGGFDGRWEGALEFVSPDAYDPDFGYKTTGSDYAFAIRGGTVSVYSKGRTGWQEAMPGGFRIATHKTNGIIFGHQSSAEEQGGKTFGWVETWNFTFTHKDETTLLVLFTRVIHNLGVPFDYQSADARGRMITVAHGEFSRTGDVKVP